jgi:hypothetical protein
MIFHREKQVPMIVGIVISLIVLALGTFLYMRSEGGDVSELSKQQKGATTTTPSVIETSVQGEPMVVSDGQGTKPFIMAIIPGDAVLDGGAYRTSVGKMNVRVRAINVESGILYFKPSTSKQIDVQPDEKVGDLQPSKDLPGEYVLPFELKKGMSGLLIAVMKGKDGQEIQLSVNVASK